MNDEARHPEEERRDAETGPGGHAASESDPGKAGDRPGKPDPGVRAEAIRVLAEVERGAWSDRLLQSRSRRFADARERRFLNVLVLATLRWQGALDRILAPFVHGGLARLRPEVRAALRLGVAQATVLGKQPAIAGDTTVSAMRALGGPRPAGLVNAVLRQVFSGEVPQPDPAATIPAWLHRRWVLRYGAERTERLVQAALRPARPFLVARPDRGGRERLAEALAREGVETRPARRHPWGLVVQKGAPQLTEAFARGDFLLVDEGAALVAALAMPTDGEAVADLAAAPGGKAAILAQGETAGIVALEIFPRRARNLAALLARRAPAGKVAPIVADATRPPLPRERFGTVLLDAPCSGTGTFRRRPEKRHRVRPEDIPDCAERQARMLDAAAPLVAPGGVLVYAVCSLEEEEGIGQARAFLERHPGFVPVDPGAVLGSAADGLVAEEGGIPYLATRPEDEDTDGFVAVRFARRTG